jgi:hypothetical protein
MLGLFAPADGFLLRLLLLASRLAAGETLLRPTAMLYRNLVSMDVEESIRFAPSLHPITVSVLLAQELS